MTARSRAAIVLAVGALVIAGVLWAARTRVSPDGAPEKPVAASSPEPLHQDKRIVTDAERADALARSHLWRAPRVPIGEARLVGDHTPIQELSCKFRISDLGGTTPKFDCLLESGEEIRIKYGKGPEIPAETAATRLLSALGFGADDVTLVEKLRCYGCPDEPFSTMKAVEVTRAEPLYRQVVNYEEYEEFEWVAREQKYPARPIETDQGEGWAFFELDLVDAARGGAPRAHVDALRLMAVFLAHWDNKAENQRLVCLSAEWPHGTPCSEPYLLLQDVGATFGPSKVDLDAWRQSPIWENRQTCAISMKHLPYGGATFAPAVVTEPGRRFFAGLLSQLRETQIRDLFAGARFDQKRGLFSSPRPVDEWVRAFQDKVRSVTEGPPCPAS